MPALPKASLVALALVSTLAGCGSDSKSANPGPTASTSETSVTTPTAGTPSATPSTSASADPQGSPTSAECGAIAGRTIPDGTWRGPITAEIRGDGEKTGYAPSRGTGQLTMTVRNGTVSNGTWTLTWKSHGEVDTGQAAASVDFTGKITGTATGSAAKPNLAADWKIDGIAKVSKPQQMSSPFDETGTDKRPMTIKSSTCAQVTGTFSPVVVSKETAATFTVSTQWIGTRQ